MNRMTWKSSDNKEAPQKIHPSMYLPFTKKHLMLCPVPFKISQPVVGGPFFPSGRYGCTWSRTPNTTARRSSCYLLIPWKWRRATAVSRCNWPQVKGWWPRKAIWETNRRRSKHRRKTTSSGKNDQNPRKKHLRTTGEMEKKHQKNHTNQRLPIQNWRGKIPATFLFCT